MSRFFIDRPIFASVLSIVITLAGGIAVLTLPIAQYPEITPPTVEVSAYYPGANAKVVADTVAAPIEQQVNGVEGMLYMSSQCTNDGMYTLTVTFKPGVDLNMAQVLVQNRESLAEPILPDLVKRRGVTVKKKSPSILMIVNLFSPSGTRDNLYLSNYATIQLRDELARLEGVGDITYLGQRDYSMRIWLDPRQDVVPEPDRDRRLDRHRPAEHPGGRRPDRPAPGAQRPGLPVHDDDSRLAWRTRSSSRTSSSRPTPMAGSSGSETSPGSSWGPRATTRPAPSTATPRSPSRSTSGPGSNALKTADLVKQKMEDLKKRFEEGVDYAIVYDTTPFITESVNEVFKTLARRGHPRGRGGPALPPELALRPDPPGRRPGGHRRHLRRHGRHGLQPE